MEPPEYLVDLLQHSLFTTNFRVLLKNKPLLCTTEGVSKSRYHRIRLITTIGEFTLRPLSACSRVFSVNPPLQKHEERSVKDYKQLQSECPFFIHPLLKFENLAFLTILSVYYHLSQ